jgi:hypothetical protein
MQNQLRPQSSWRTHIVIIEFFLHHYLTHKTYRKLNSLVAWNVGIARSCTIDPTIPEHERRERTVWDLSRFVHFGTLKAQSG